MIDKTISRAFIFKGDYEGEERIAYYPVYCPYEIDYDGHYATPYEIRRACHEFMKYLTVMENHSRDASDMFEIVENFCAPCDLVYKCASGEQVVPQDSWIIGLRALTDNAWEGVKSGKYSGVSMGIRARVEGVDINNVKNLFKSVSTDEDITRICELKDIIPLEISVTGSPKTGRTLLLTKAKEVSNMSDTIDFDELLKAALSDKAARALKRALRMLDPYKDEFPASFWRIIDKLIGNQYYPAPKSLDGYDIPVELSEYLKATFEENRKLRDELMKMEADREAERLATIKKSYDDFVSTIGFIPFDKAKLSDTLYRMHDEMGKEFCDVIKEALVKANNILAEQASTSSGSSASVGSTSQSIEERFDALVKAELALDKSNRPYHVKYRDAVSAVSRKHPDIFDEYNKSKVR